MDRVPFLEWSASWNRNGQIHSLKRVPKILLTAENPKRKLSTFFCGELLGDYFYITNKAYPIFFLQSMFEVFPNQKGEIRKFLNPISACC